MKSLRGLPTSRAYWELRAEQMMNRIFEPEPTIDVDAPADGEARDTAAAAGASVSASRQATPEASPKTATVSPSRGRPRRDPQVLLFSLLGGVCMVSAASSALYLGHWNRMQQSLREERNLLLMERLRELGPAQSAAAGEAATVATLPPPAALPGEVAPASRPGDDLPPPPPEEPWMAQLDQLPPSEPMPVLQVPVSPQLAQPAPAAPPQLAAAGPAPQLLGVVAAPGKAGSAIFQVGGSTSNVGVGESIGASGWRLRSAEGDGVLIERAGQVRRLSIGSGP